MRVVKSAVTKQSSLRVCVTSALVRVSAAGQPSSSAITPSGWMPVASRKLSTGSRPQSAPRGSPAWQSMATWMIRPCAATRSRAARDMAAYRRLKPTNDGTGFSRLALASAKRRSGWALSAGGVSRYIGSERSAPSASAVSWSSGVEARTTASNSPTFTNSSIVAWTPSTPQAPASSVAEASCEQIAARVTPGVLISVGTVTSAACGSVPTSPTRRVVMPRGLHDRVRSGRRTEDPVDAALRHRVVRRPRDGVDLLRPLEPARRRSQPRVHPLDVQRPAVPGRKSAMAWSWAASSNT